MQLKKQLKNGYKNAVLSDQDKNPIIALVHCITALNYLEVIQNIVSPTWVQKHLKNDIHTYQDALTARVEYIFSHIFKTYPKLSMQSKYLPSSGWHFGAN